VEKVERAVSACRHVIVNMADFAAADRPPAQVCIDRVCECDVYVGVLGTQYGSPVLDKPEVSYTELEFDTATQAGLHRLVFLLNTDAEDLRIPPSGLVDREFGARQDAFRHRVQNSGLLTQSFDSPAALGQLVERSLKDLAERYKVPGRPPWGGVRQVWNIPARNPAFTGRAGLLAAVLELLQAGDTAVVQAFQGIGGVGKSQLAIEYAHRFTGDYDVGWWVDSEQPGLIGDQFAALGLALGCVQPGAGAETVRTSVLAELHGRARWLLVFDNAQSPADIGPWLPGGAGHVLITSRAGNWADIAVPVKVGVLARPESIVILQDRLDGLSPTDADKLGAQLGDLPLAITQAAGFMAETGTAPAEYLDLLETQAGQLLDQAAPETYPESLAAATQLIAGRLNKEDPAAAQLANLCAFLAPEPIPKYLFTSALGELPTELADRAANPLHWRQTLLHLVRQSLAQVDQRGLVMHRLTQAILRDHLPPGQAAATRAQVEAILAASNPGGPANPATWPRWAPLMPHLLAADLAGTSNPRLRSTACDACWYLLARGETRSGHELASRLHQQWCDRLSIDDPDTLMMATYLAWALEDLGKLRAARDLGRDTLARRRRVLGENNRSTLVTASNLVATLGRLSELEDARDLLEEARNLAEDTLERSRSALGEDDFETLRAASNLAGVLRGLGQVSAALKLRVDILARRRRLLPEDHPSVLLAAGNEAVSRRDVGDLDEAWDLGQDTLTRMRRVLGEDHPDTLATAVDLVVTLRARGERRAAQELEEDTLSRLRRVLGDDHPDTLAALKALAADQDDPGEPPNVR
jgi:hypothetical protein